MVHSFLLIGQSNMAGRGFIKEATPIDTSNIKVLRNGRWQPMYRPINCDRGFAGVSLAESFAEKYAKEHGCTVGLIGCADGGVSLNHWQPGEALFENAVYMEFLENCEMKKYPEDELKQWSKVMEDSYSMYASYYGMETDEFLQMYYGTTIEKLAKEQILFKYAAELVAEEEGMTLSLEDYEKAIEEQAVEFGYDSAEEYEKAYNEYYGEGYLESYILQEKVMSWLVENSTTAE
jgi:hypothetical protein